MRQSADRPLAVDLPREAEDRPQWVKVGVIAAVGFAVGIAWPRLAGVRLGPSAPGDAPPAASAPAAAPRANDAPVAVPVVSAAPAVVAAPAVPSATPNAPSSAAAPPPPASSSPPKVVVARGVVLSCKTNDGEALKGSKECGALPGFDAIVQPRIRRVKDCSAAEGATGKLSVVFGVDFANNRVNVDLGKASSVPNVESIGTCVKQQFAGISLGALDHEHPRYTISYNATLSPADAPGAANAASTPAATPTPAPAVSAEAATASVVWEVAIVRDAPRTGQVVGRIQRGSKVRVGQGQDNWYRVRYGTGLTSEGWVYRGAIGK